MLGLLQGLAVSEVDVKRGLQGLSVAHGGVLGLFGTGLGLGKLGLEVLNPRHDVPGVTALHPERRRYGVGTGRLDGLGGQVCGGPVRAGGVNQLRPCLPGEVHLGG